MKYLCIFQSAVQTSQLQYTAPKAPAAGQGVADQRPCDPSSNQATQRIFLCSPQVGWSIPENMDGPAFLRPPSQKGLSNPTHPSRWAKPRVPSKATGRVSVNLEAAWEALLK